MSTSANIRANLELTFPTFFNLFYNTFYPDNNLYYPTLLLLENNEDPTTTATNSGHLGYRKHSFTSLICDKYLPGSMIALFLRKHIANRTTLTAFI